MAVGSMKSIHDNLPVVFENEHGCAVYWFATDRNTRCMYRIYYYNSNREPLATNVMDIVHTQLNHKDDMLSERILDDQEIEIQYGQLQLIF